MNRGIDDCRITAVERVNRGGNYLLGHEIQLKYAGLRGLARLHRFKQHTAFGGFQPVKPQNAVFLLSLNKILRKAFSGKALFGKAVSVDILKGGLHVKNGIIYYIRTENAVFEDVLKSVRPLEEDKPASAAPVDYAYRSGISSAFAVEGDRNDLIDSARNY